jgi:hypothetical protein
MKNIIIDTCVVIHIVRESESGKRCLDALFSLNRLLTIPVSAKISRMVED